MSNVINMAEWKEGQMMARFYELMVGDLDAAAVAVLETLPEAELELFMRLRKRVQSEIAEDLMRSQIRMGLPINPYR